MLMHLCIWLGYSLSVPTKLAHFMWGRGEGWCAFSRCGTFLKKKKKDKCSLHYVAEASLMNVIAPNQCL